MSYSGNSLPAVFTFFYICCIYRFSFRALATDGKTAQENRDEWYQVRRSSVCNQTVLQQ